VHFNSVHEAAAKGISVIHQELSLVGPTTIAENIFLAREKSAAGWLHKNAMTKQARELLHSLGLDIDVLKQVADYPLSIQQMIEICKALAFDCRIIVMDEPTSALTKPEVEKLFAIIDQLKSRGCGIIYITHKMEEIYRVADRITVLRDGRYIGTAKAAELPQNKLVQWMVGRELNQQFPRHIPQLGDVRLEVSNFTVPDPSGKPAPAVNKVSFSVRSGEILGIAGLSGSGNSELLNGIFGTYGKIVTGTVKIDGENFKTSSPEKTIRHRIALLTNDRQATGLVTDMNIVHNTTLAALRKFSPVGWLKPKQELTAAQNQRESLKLKAASLLQPVKSLSGGNQQKIVIAKWIETQPIVFLLDEPTRGVDVGAKHEIYELMNKWTSQGIAIVLITSEMPELLAMSDRIIVMHRGRITAEFSRETATQEKILKAAMGEGTQN
jgi:ABC-type sugar transport system ATPase subunit